MECLQNVVGLSRSECDCYEDNRPVDFNTSLSGLYITDLVSLEMTGGSEDCEKGGVWSILQTSLDRAILSLRADIPAAFNVVLEPRFTPFKGWAGGIKFNSSKAVLNNGNYTGLRFTPHQIKGGVITLQGVELALQNVANGTTVDVMVICSNDLNTVLATASVTLTTANAFYYAAFDSPLVLDISDRASDGYTYNDPNLEYYIVYQMPVGGRYINNTILESGCMSCGGAMKPQSSRQYPFLQYGKLNGIEAQNIASLPVPRSTDNSARSLRLKADWGCDSMQWLCNITYDVTDTTAGEYRDYGRVIANALQQKAAFYTVQSILDSGNINAITVWDTEKLYGKRSHFEKNYNTAIQWLSVNFPKSLSDCYECKTTIYKSSLKA